MMKKSKEKDISFDSDLQISSAESRFPKSKYFDIIIVFLGVIGATYVFISSFDLEYNKIVIPCAITCSVLLFSYICTNYKKKRKMRFPAGKLLYFIKKSITLPLPKIQYP